jgi:tripartite-type tricarboxylate transporter receptor subunit TctC
MGLLKEGRLVALAVSTPTRVAALPDVPTIAEAGYPGGEFIFWVGALTPSKTPREIVAKLNAEINRALRSADMRERLEKLGGEPMSMNAAQFDSFIRQEYDVLGKVMRNAGAVPQ